MYQLRLIQGILIVIVLCQNAKNLPYALAPKICAEIFS
ncbi:hypothetical protein S7335_4204 [Synechococcus sp. PCC 7335]|nr:hypothetical protein S7335_4204 [Synechococcus sp. PCC 7335]